MTDHAYLPPSAAHTWSECALWATMNAKYPQESSSEADEGFAAHWVAWEMLVGSPMTLNTPAPNGLLTTEEMLEGGDLIVDCISTRSNGNQVHVEERISISSIAPGMFGTPDAWSFDAKLCHLEIFDYKFGHRFVDEYWNPQGLCYLSGIVDVLSTLYKVPPTDWEPYMTVAFTVVQPRCFYRGNPVRTHEFRLSECRSYFNALANAAEASRVANPIAKTNEHCGDCPGRHSCSALQKAAYAAASYSSKRNVVELTPSDAALELKMLSTALGSLTARVEGLKELTIQNLTNGKQVPYYRAEPGQGRQTWNVPAAQVIALGQISGISLAKQPEAVTPNQAKKLGVNEALVNSLSFTPSTATRLIPETASDAAKVFGRS